MGTNSDSIIFKVLGFFIIGILAILANSNCIDAEFLFDDTEAILKNRDILPYTPIGNIFKNDFWGTELKSERSHKSYRPLTVLSFRLNYILSDGLDNLSFHLTNIILHAVISILSWSVFCKILGNNRDLIGFLAALLFAAHPVHTEAVCSTVGRADLLAAFFFFLSFLSYTGSYTESFCGYIWMILSICFAGISMLCKEQGITVLGFLCVYDVFHSSETTLGKVLGDLCKRFTGKRSKPYISKLIRRQLVLITSCALLILLRCYLMGFKGPKFHYEDNPASFEKKWLTRVLTHNYIYALNSWLLLCPEWLCFDWSMGCVPLLTTSSDRRVFFVLIFWLCFAFFLWKALTAKSVSKQRTMVISFSLIIIPFLPAANIFFPVGFVIAERVLYIPSAGFCLLIACGMEVLMRFAPSHKNDLMFGFFVVATVFLIRSYRRSADWATENLLFNAGISVCPLNAKVHYNVGKCAFDRRNFDKAESEYREAIRLFPTYELALNNLANVLRGKGRMSEAEDLLKTALAIREDFPAAWMNLGIIMAQSKKYKEAESSYKTALKYRKGYADCHYNLGNLYLHLNRTVEAEKAWLNAVQLRPTFGLAWHNLMLLNDNNGNTERAIQLGNDALKHVPDDPGVHFQMGNALGKIGEFEKAEHHLLKSLKENPANPRCYLNLGVLYHKWKKYRHAMEYYKIAYSLDPNSKTAKEMYEVVKRKITSHD